MERCAFVMDVPPVTGSGEFMGSTHYKIVEIWHLESPQLLERVSWASKPRRTGLLGTVYVKAGESTGSPEFPCPANSLHTFEIACSSSMCHVEFQLDRKKPGQGLFRLSHSPSWVCTHTFQQLFILNRCLRFTEGVNKL
jgi:hypothetical protein